MDKTLWIKSIKREYKDETHWAKLRIKKDKDRRDYIDILIGNKQKPWHIHIGISLDDTLLFEEYRGQAYSIQREVISKRRGLLEDKKSIINNKVKPLKKLKISIDKDGKTREVKISRFELV